MYRIMIVDDMDIARLELRRLNLWGEKSGFIIVSEAKNGEDALEKIKNTPVDMVITDIRMPKIDGIELLRNIVERNLCSCVVLLSDFSEFSYAKQGIILGAFDYISKPVNEEELSSLLQRAATYIENKQKQEIRIKKLEETVGEKTEMQFQADDILQLVETILHGENPLDDASRIVEIASALFNHDLLKVQSTLKNGTLQVVNGLMEKSPWLHKFVNIQDFRNLNFYGCNQLKDAKKLFIESILKIADLLNSLTCKIHDGSVTDDVCSYILNHVDNELSLGLVAKKLFMNRNYISEAFKQKTGKTFVEYVTLVKMERAKILIAVEHLKAYQVAEILGFRDTEYFSRIFKKHVGMSPTDFRQTA